MRRRDALKLPLYDLLPEMGALGLFPLAAPAEEGGLGQAWTTVALVQEELGRRAYFGVQSLPTCGSAEQRSALSPLQFDGRALLARSP